MWQLEKYTIQGTSPLVMHNGELADPLNPYSKQLKVLTAKRNKTEAIWEEIAKIEFLGGLYYDGNHVILPSRVIKKPIILAARKSKQGKLAEVGIRCSVNAVLTFPGQSQLPKELWEDKNHRYRTMVVIQKSRIPRMRPIFHEWSTTLSIHRNTDIVNEPMLKEWIKVAGLYVGFCEERPERGGEYGCFELDQNSPH